LSNQREFYNNPDARVLGNVSAQGRLHSRRDQSIRTTNGSILRRDWKFALDITCILLALPIWLPLMILLMLVMRIASPGPIFYRQERVGLGGKHFSMWKFRTMQVSAETQTHEHYFHELMKVDRPMTKLDAYGDPRLAPFGRFLRASGLDELPQIFNVVCGEMSLIGPRPCTPNEFARYEPWQRERVNGLPGLTGHWQVNGKNKTTFNEMIMMDLFYLENMSVLLDLKIMLKTGAVIAGQLLESQQAAQRKSVPEQTVQSLKRRYPSQRPGHPDPKRDSKPIARLRTRSRKNGLRRRGNRWVARAILKFYGNIRPNKIIWGAHCLPAVCERLVRHRTDSPWRTSRLRRPRRTPSSGSAVYLSRR
jgi:lipopolysaccharide/colanic/teichoic acid biosynthesis glycosyltransferase